MPNNIKEFTSNLETVTHDEWDNIRISIMVFGPNTDGREIGSQLRKYIIEKCSEYGILVRTEHEDLKKVHSKILGSGRNLCGLEYNTAKHVNAIVMIPDSPGSLVELGMFAFAGKICSKTLILFRDKYSLPDAQLSFVYLGPKLSYEERKAKIEFVNYRRKKLVWQRVRAFLHEIKALKWEESALRELLP